MVDANILFPSENTTSTANVSVAATPVPSPSRSAPAGSLIDPVAQALFGAPEKTDADAGRDFLTDGKDEFKETVSVLDQFALSAFGEGDRTRGEAIKSARDALIDDAKDHGSDPASFNAAFEIVREVNTSSLLPPTAEELEASFASGIETIRQEYGSGWLADLDAARAFIRDLEVKAPGTMASLERFGAGSDPRIIRKVISEARRRGY